MTTTDDMIEMGEDRACRPYRESRRLRRARPFQTSSARRDRLRWRIRGGALGDARSRRCGSELGRGDWEEPVSGRVRRWVGRPGRIRLRAARELGSVRGRRKEGYGVLTRRSRARRGGVD
jgi:hypothetical protein